MLVCLCVCMHVHVYVHGCVDKCLCMSTLRLWHNLDLVWSSVAFYLALPLLISLGVTKLA